MDWTGQHHLQRGVSTTHYRALSGNGGHSSRAGARWAPLTDGHHGRMMLFWADIGL